MKMTLDKMAINGVLRWLMKAVLVLGLFTFSGHVSEHRLSSPEPTKTELSEERRVDDKRSVCFKRAFDKLNTPLFYSPNQADRFGSYLLCVEKYISTKLKDNFRERPTNLQRKSFLIYYAAVKSKEFDSHQVSG